jgi:hypothetical protein
MVQGEANITSARNRGLEKVGGNITYEALQRDRRGDTHLGIVAYKPGVSKGFCLALTVTGGRRCPLGTERLVRQKHKMRTEVVLSNTKHCTKKRTGMMYTHTHIYTHVCMLYIYIYIYIYI